MIDRTVINSVLGMIIDSLRNLENLDTNSVIQRLEIVQRTHPSTLLQYLELTESTQLIETVLHLSALTDSSIGDAADSVLRVFQAVSAENKDIVLKLAKVIRDSVPVIAGKEDESLPCVSLILLWSIIARILI